MKHFLAFRKYKRLGYVLTICAVLLFTRTSKEVSSLIDFVNEPIVSTIIGSGILAAIVAYFNQKLTSDINGNNPVSMGTQIAGEDLNKHLMSVMYKPVSGAVYSTYEFNSSKVADTLHVANDVNVYAVMAVIKCASDVYLQLFDQVTTPDDNDKPICSYYVPNINKTERILQLDSNFFTPSQYFSRGVAYGISKSNVEFIEADVTLVDIHIRYAL